MQRVCLAFLFGAALAGCGSTTDILGVRSESSAPNEEDALGDRLDLPQDESGKLIRSAFEQLFFGDPETQAVYYEAGDDAAYVEDIKYGDVRTDSIGYGMFVSVQVGEQEVFDKLWTWAKRYMLRTQRPRAGLLMWRCATDGTDCGDSAATDATATIATSLFMAKGLWGDSEVHDYESDANMLVDAAVETETNNGGTGSGVQNLFDVEARLPRRTSSAGEEAYLRTEYLMPAFYDYWALWRPKDAEFWNEVAAASRALLRIAPGKGNGLIPVRIYQNGAVLADYSYHDEVSARTVLNRWFSLAWSGPYPWMVEDGEELLDFLLEQGDYVSSYYMDGRKRGSVNTAAHLALVATAAAKSSRPDDHDVFLQALVDAPIPEDASGAEDPTRYYDGMLYLIGLLAVSGHIQAPVP